MKKIILMLLTAGLLMSCNQQKPEENTDASDQKNENAIEIGNPDDVQVDEGGVFKMKGLPYAYDALEPNIDAQTMEIHYSRHHLGYANKLNKAVEGTEMANMTIEEVLKKLDPENKAVRNNAGGYYNHNLFWEILGPNKGEKPQGELANAINKDFGSFDEFKKQLTQTALTQFGSGWGWLVTDKEGKLSLISTPNQDNPLMTKLGYSGAPILGIDVWEHAYYLNYQNKRKDYIEAVFNVINWEKVAENYNHATSNE
jgi:superoxide dismutase, Fe-Mn family